MVLRQNNIYFEQAVNNKLRGREELDMTLILLCTVSNTKLICMNSNIWFFISVSDSFVADVEAYVLFYRSVVCSTKGFV